MAIAATLITCRPSRRQTAARREEVGASGNGGNRAGAHQQPRGRTVPQVAVIASADPACTCRGSSIAAKPPAVKFTPDQMKAWMDTRATWQFDVVAALRHSGAASRRQVDCRQQVQRTRHLRAALLPATGRCSRDDNVTVTVTTLEP